MRLTESRHPSYHLRPNKAIDRLLFVDLMRALDQYGSINKYTYISFAGPFLEDTRVVAQAFPKLSLISVESDRETYARQRFHSFSRRFQPYHGTFKDFLINDFPAGPTIAWPDFTDCSRESLLQISDVARLSSPLSLLRVTVEAETPVYKALGLGARHKTLPKSKRGQFDDFLDEFWDRHAVEGVSYSRDDYAWSDFGIREFPRIVTHIILCIIEAACVRPKQFLPLHAVMYSDGTVMLSLTGIFCDADDRESLIRHFRNKNVLPKGELSVDVIDVPVLTTKERFHLEQCLPLNRYSGARSRTKLGYLVEGDGSFETSTYRMQQYEKYHQYYPYFTKMTP